MAQDTLQKPLTIRMHERDNVAIVANDGGLPAGTELPSGLKLVERVPQGHKVALADLPEGTAVLRYNVTIGYALRDIPAGSWVHERLLRMPSARALDNLPIATANPEPKPPLDGYTFEGYRNPDGSVGTRNILAITQTVQCVAGVTEFAVQRIRSELLPRFPNVDDVVALDHTYGCGVAIDAPDAIVPIRTLRNISLNPNFGGEVMVISLGCEKLQPERLLPPGTIPIIDERNVADIGNGDESALDVVCLQDDKHVGFLSMIDSIVTQAEEHLERLNGRRRETVPASELVVGVQCGGSDAFSGVTANPAVGFCSDLLVRAGATVMFSEVTEVRDGIDQLTSRAASPEVARAMIREMAWYDGYLEQGPGRPQRQHDSGQQEGRPVEHRREGDGLDREVGQRTDLRRFVARREGGPERADLRGDAGQRFHMRHLAARGGDEPARVHDRPGHAVWIGAGSGDQGRHAHRPGPALARPHGCQCGHDRYR